MAFSKKWLKRQNYLVVFNNSLVKEDTLSMEKEIQMCRAEGASKKQIEEIGAETEEIKAVNCDNLIQERNSLLHVLVVEHGRLYWMCCVCSKWFHPEHCVGENSKNEPDDDICLECDFLYRKSPKHRCKTRSLREFAKLDEHSILHTVKVLKGNTWNCFCNLIRS
ncbi:hypothetical protein LOTGIDRAFT_239597 [Lottia gigantea]|uniref:Uncharacterized protein n=1 Tax=Lottia gigantea TaxID=225164 RepID=V3ZK95_LOTGI|nr:hypothetical protein LOTGIDRAFT_239597 [Lottia gigantea]ESO91733.1 hypothetical protein LOTGIDRAFT_239597 [Lottia gigantea]